MSLEERRYHLWFSVTSKCCTRMQSTLGHILTFPRKPTLSTFYSECRKRTLEFVTKDGKCVMLLDCGLWFQQQSFFSFRLSSGLICTAECVLVLVEGLLVWACLLCVIVPQHNHCLSVECRYKLRPLLKLEMSSDNNLILTWQSCLNQCLI